MMLSKKHFLSGIAIGTVLLFAYVFSLPDGRLHIVFCDVGQGDAAYIHTPSNQDMLIDGGPNDKVLSCLGKYMPFYDRTIDIVMVSHPQKDHLQGLISVVRRYNIKFFIIGVVGNQSQGYKRLIRAVREKNIPIKNLYSGDKYKLGSTEFNILWPERNWLVQAVDQDSSSSDRNSPILGLSTSRDLNHFSFYLHLKHNQFDILFTGDGDARIQSEILSRVSLPDVEVLKFPHHGSKYGATFDFLDQVLPELAVISVGKNPWGHPTAEAIKLLNNQAIKILRTDREGDIEVISDGVRWWVE